MDGAYRTWSSEDARFLRQFMENLADDGVRIIVHKTSAQSAKTETALAGLQWIFSQRPGPTLWLTHDHDEAKNVAKDRINPSLDLCEPLRGMLPVSRTKRTQLAIYIAGALLRIAGAKTKGALDQTPYKYLFCDEARTYKKGTLTRVDKRTRAYSYNYKKVIFSTPDQEGDEFDLAFKAGNQEEWFVKCSNPDCRHEQQIVFGFKHDAEAGIKWVENEKTLLPDGTPVYDELLKTVYWECEKCHHKVGGTDIEPFSLWRKDISRDGRWIPQNPNAPSDYVSRHWNAFVPYWPDWRKAVHEFLEAKKAAKWGNWEPLKEFVQQTLGLSWSDEMMSLGQSVEIEKRQYDYNPRDIPPPPVAIRGKEVTERRFMTLDVQASGGRHFWCVIRHWWKGGASKLILADKLYTYEEIAQKALDWGVDPLNIILDAAFASSEVYQQVVASGRKWKAYWGDDRYSFLVDKVHRLVQVTTADPAIGTRLQGRAPLIPLYRFAKYGVLDRLTMLQNGQAGDWQFPLEVHPDYISQVTAYEKLPVVHKKLGTTKRVWHKVRKHDHFTSCEMTQVAAASVTGLIYDGEEVTGPASEDPQRTPVGKP